MSSRIVSTVQTSENGKGGDAGENSRQDLGPWRPPAPQPWRRAGEERKGFYSLGRKETSLGKRMRSV